MGNSGGSTGFVVPRRAFALSCNPSLTSVPCPGHGLQMWNLHSAPCPLHHAGCADPEHHRSPGAIFDEAGPIGREHGDDSEVAIPARRTVSALMTENALLGGDLGCNIVGACVDA